MCNIYVYMYTVGCRYNAVQDNMILHISLTGLYSLWQYLGPQPAIRIQLTANTFLKLFRMHDPINAFINNEPFIYKSAISHFLFHKCPYWYKLRHSEPLYKIDTLECALLLNLYPIAEIFGIGYWFCWWLGQNTNQEVEFAKYTP